MSKQSINTLKNWFKRGLKPLEEHFSSWLDSYWHKDDTDIPMSSISGLSNALNGLATTQALNAIVVELTHFKGRFLTLEALTENVPEGNSGDYATVDAGPGEVVVEYIWDTDTGWTISASSSPTSNVVDMGPYDASTNTFPEGIGSGSSGEVLRANEWYLSVGGILDGEFRPAGTLIRSKINLPGQDAPSWLIR